jgi:hypothetical protein
MLGGNRISLRAILGLAGIAVAFAGCSSLAGAPAPGARVAPDGLRMDSQDLYIGNILGGVPLYSTGKNPHEVGDITDGVPRVTSVWVDQTGVLYAFSDNRQYPYETIEEYEPGGTTPFFSLVLKRYGSVVAADSAQNVYAQGENGAGQQVIDVYPPGSQNYANEYVVPSIGQISAVEGMAFDASGALLVGVAALANNKQGQVGAVFRLSAGSSTFVNLNLKKAYGGLIATDGAGNLYVGGGSVVSVYAPGATSSSRIVHTKNAVDALTAAADGTLYVGSYTGAIAVYAPGKRSSKKSFVAQAQVSGLALGPR